jgi:hypothetical protein
MGCDTRLAVQAWDMLVVVDVSKRGRGIVSAHSGLVAGMPTPYHFLTSLYDNMVLFLCLPTTFS